MSRTINPTQVQSEGHCMRFLSDDGTHYLTDDETAVLPADVRCDAVCCVAVCVLPAGHDAGRSTAAALVTP